MTHHNRQHVKPSTCEKETLECLECALDLIVRCCYALEGNNRLLYRDLTAFLHDLSSRTSVVDYTPYV